MMSLKPDSAGREITVTNTDTNDLDRIFDFFDHSIRYQEKNGYPSWRNYDQRAVMNDIKNHNHYKVAVDGDIGIVFSVCYTDAVIWEELERGDSLYLHRIVVNPHFRGQKLFGEVLTWAIAHAKQNGLKYVRMDTWAANTVIQSYYKTFGFKVVRNMVTPDTDALPVHNRNLPLTLLEYKIYDPN